MRYPSAVAFAAVLAVTAAAPFSSSHAAAAADAPKVTTANASTLMGLLQEAKLTPEKEEGDRIKILYKFTDGRSQLVFLQPMSDIREIGVVEVYSPVMKLNGPVTAALGKRLLEANGSQKLGYFGVEDVEGKPWVFCYHNLPTTGMNSKNLAATLITVAELADEMEKEQLGAAKDEF